MTQAICAASNNLIIYSFIDVDILRFKTILHNNAGQIRYARIPLKMEIMLHDVQFIEMTFIDANIFAKV